MNVYVNSITRFLFLVLAVLLTTSTLTVVARAQSDTDFLTEAIRLAQESQRETTVPASVTIAQAIWETGWGRSPIGEANNYFGIKAAVQLNGSVNTGPVAIGWVWAWTKEWNGKQYVDSRERFRKYSSMADSFRDHGLLISQNPRYAQAMAAVDDPREFARQIAAAGYATSPTYAADLIGLMDQENLYQYDLPRNDAELVGQSEYPRVAPGEIFQIYFDVRNLGFGAWSAQTGYFLASQNEQPFTVSGRQYPEAVVPAGAVKRWAITLVAPTEPGRYRTAWRMQHGTQAFGPELSLEVQVGTGGELPEWAVPAASAAAVIVGLVLLWSALRGSLWLPFGGRHARS